MARTIYKYKLSMGSPINEPVLPAGSNILYVGLQDDEIYIWVEQPSRFNDPQIYDYQFYIIGTGWEVPNNWGNLDYIGTVQPSNGLVWHIYRGW